MRRLFAFVATVILVDTMFLAALVPLLPEYVDELGISGPEDTRPRCGNLPLCPTELVDSRPHRIHVKEGL